MISATQEVGNAVLKYKLPDDTEQTVQLTYGGTTYETEDIVIGEAVSSVYDYIRIYDTSNQLLVDLTDYVLVDEIDYYSAIPDGALI